jgi:hypothetical protein
MARRKPAQRLKAPEALEPVYTTASPNEPIVLYEGPLRFGRGKGSFTASGKVLFRWFPTPRVVAECSGVANPFALGNLRSPIITVPNRGWTSEVGLERAGGSDSVLNVVVCDGLEGYLGKSGKVRRLTWHLPNTCDLHGSGIRNRDGSISFRRVVLDGEPWRVTLDYISGSRERLRELGGFAFTHVASLERIDNKSFIPDEARHARGVLAFFLSLCRGLWVFPLLEVGYSARGRCVWERWATARIDSYDYVRSWLPMVATDALSRSWGTLLRLSRDADMDLNLKTAIHWYVEANKQSGAVHGSVVMIQAALELLQWLVFTQSKRILLNPEKINAADKMRLLLDRVGLELTIPPALKALVAEAKGQSWHDGPQALVEIRNRITHPPKGAKVRSRHSNNVVAEAWRLGLHYLELTILWLLKYEGGYVSRVSSNPDPMAGAAVPWATDTSH